VAKHPIFCAYANGNTRTPEEVLRKTPQENDKVTLQNFLHPLEIRDDAELSARHLEEGTWL
jgi:hypothetical protein